MKNSVFVVLLVALCGLSCSPRKMLVSSSSTDSVASSSEKEYVERWRTDTVIVEVPGASVERTVKDSTSYIAKHNVRSTARINSDGTLYHDLFIDALKKAMPVRIKDSETKEITTERQHGSTRIEFPVKLPPTQWQRFWCTSGKVGWGVLAALAGLLIYKIIRK